MDGAPAPPSTWRSRRRGSRLGHLRPARGARSGERAAAGRISRRGDDDRRQLVPRTTGGGILQNGSGGHHRGRLVAPASCRSIPGHRDARRHHPPSRPRQENREALARSAAGVLAGAQRPLSGRRTLSRISRTTLQRWPGGRSGCTIHAGDGASIGMFRIVACVSAFTWASQSASPHQLATTKPGRPSSAALNSS